MGEIAEAIINGFLCDKCTCIVDGDEPGYPRKCSDCKPRKKRKKKKKGKPNAPSNPNI